MPDQLAAAIIAARSTSQPRGFSQPYPKAPQGKRWRKISDPIPGSETETARGKLVKHSAYVLAPLYPALNHQTGQLQDLAAKSAQAVAAQCADLAAIAARIAELPPYAAVSPYARDPLHGLARIAETLAALIAQFPTPEPAE